MKIVKEQKNHKTEVKHKANISMRWGHTILCNTKDV